MWRGILYSVRISSALLVREKPPPPPTMRELPSKLTFDAVQYPDDYILSTIVYHPEHL